MTIIDGGDNLAAFAQALAAEGILTERDISRAERAIIRGQPPHLLPLCSAALARWVAAETKGLKFAIGLTFTDDWSEHFGELEDCFQREKEYVPPGAFLFIFRTDMADWCCIGPRITELEEYREGLGASVLRILEDAFNDTIGCFGPRHAHGTVQGYHWSGESDHHMRLDEYHDEVGYHLEPFQIGEGHGAVTIEVVWKCGGTNHCEAVTWDIPSEVPDVWIDVLDHEEYMLTKEEFNERLPAWCCSFTAKTLSPEKLQRLTVRAPKHLREAVRQAADLGYMLRHRPAGGDGHKCYPIHDSIYPILLGWEMKTDMVARMYDDHAQNVMESGEGTAVRNLWMFDPDKVTEIRSKIRGVRRAFAILQAASAIIKLIVTK